MPKYNSTKKEGKFQKNLNRAYLGFSRGGGGGEQIFKNENFDDPFF